MTVTEAIDPHRNVLCEGAHMFIPHFDLQLIATIEYRLIKKYEQKNFINWALLLLYCCWEKYDICQDLCTENAFMDQKEPNIRDVH